MLQIHNEGPCLEATITSRHNTLSLEAIEALRVTLENHRNDSSSAVFVLKGGGRRFFSPGFDLQHVARLARSRMRELISAFQDLYIALLEHPKPTLAFVNGDAVAGGCILASCCDFRLVVEEARIGFTPLNEVAAIPFTAQLAVQRLLGNRSARFLLLGHRVSAWRAHEMGWADEVSDPAVTEQSLEEWKRRLSRVRLENYAAVKASLRGDLTRVLEQAAPKSIEDFLEGWFAPEAQQRLRALAEAGK